MRHNDARKWLHAVLDLLPVLLIPVFMIYSHRHNVTQQSEVNIQYKYQSNEVNSVDDLVVGNVYLLSLSDFNNNFNSQLYMQEVISIDNAVYSTINTYVGLNVYNSSPYFNFVNSKFYYYKYPDDNILRYNDVTAIDVIFTYSSYNGVTDFIDYISYTDYNEIVSVEVNEYSSVMNVFMDNFNGAVDKYFNMGNVFNLNGVYQWFNTNIFNGNAPQIIYSVWNIALYELVMDLLFLLYGLFMWFIDMCKHLMEKPFKSIK